MKLRNLYYLARANIKGNKTSGTVLFLICLLVVSLTVISCFSATTTNALNLYKDDYRARAMSISYFGSDKVITKEAVNAISSVEHVEVVTETQSFLRFHPFNITTTDDTPLNEEIEKRGSIVHLLPLYEGEKKSVIKGKTLEDAPVFSCLVPSIFYPFDDNDTTKNQDYIDGTTLIGSTVTLKGFNNEISLSYLPYGGNNVELTSLKSPEYTLTIVGTFPCSYSTTGNFSSFLISRETDLLMSEMAFEFSGIDLEKNDTSLAQWWNDTTIHEHFVVVDDYSNMSEVYNTVREMGYSIGVSSEHVEDKTVSLFATLFSTVGTFLIVAVGFISVFLLVQSSSSAIRERKGYIGLMKAIGYKNRQVFSCLLMEQLFLTLRGFVIGSGVSAVLVAVANYIFEHGTYRQMQYIINWKVYFIFLMVSLWISIFVPLITEVFLLRRLTKIQPKDAMNVS